MRTMGDALRTLRKSRGYSQQKLANALGIAQTTVASYECGVREPNFETIRMLADFFHVPMTTFIPMEENADDEYVRNVAFTLQGNPKLKTLFDYASVLSDDELEPIISILSAMSRKE